MNIEHARPANQWATTTIEGFMTNKKLIPLTDIAEMQAAGLPFESVDQVRWAERTADQKGLRPAFIQIGRRIYIDPDLFHECARGQFSNEVSSAESGRARHTASHADSGHTQRPRVVSPSKPAPVARAVGVAPHLTSPIPLANPCPFCGGSRLHVHALTEDTYYVQCRECWTTGPTRESESLAVQRWNRRVPP